MKALTVMQPWAYLIVAGRKTMETRTWHTKYRGDLAIHASHTLSVVAESTIDRLEVVAPALLYPAGSRVWRFDRADAGKVIGVVELVDCLPIDAGFARALDRQEMMLGNYAEGRWAWVLEHPRRLVPPIEARGMPGLWEVTL